MKLAISSLLPNENKYRTMSDEYLRREYIENAGKLLERIEDIYKKEFQIKIIETKKAIIEYIEPHKEALHELRRKITETSNALAQIDNDRSLLGPDAEIIESSLKEKLVEMRKIEESEIVNIKNIDIFLSEIRKAKEKYSQIIDIIEQKKEKYNKRDKYLALVKSLDISIPELGNIFEELKKEFSSNIEDIKTSIFILGLSINNNLLASIEKQKEINTVLGTGRVGNYKYNEQNTNDMCDYEYDLSFLNDTNK